MGAIKRTAAPCPTPSRPSATGARPRRASNNATTIVQGGGIVRLAGSEYHAAALARYDGRRVTVRPTASNAALEVLLDGRLLCHAGMLGPGDDDTRSETATVPPSPRDGSGSAQLRLAPGLALSVLTSIRSGPHAYAGAHA